MSYLPGPVDLQKAEKKQWVKVGPQKVEKKQWVKVDHQKVEIYHIYIDVLGLYT